MYRLLICKINVLQKASKLFENALASVEGDQEKLRRNSSQLDEPLLNSSNHLFKFVYLGGTIKKQDQMVLKKLIFRSTRGKACISFFDLKVKPEDRMKKLNDTQDDMVYIVIFQEGGFIRDKIQKICASVSFDPV